MKSKHFNKMRQLRAKTRTLQKDIKRIKKARIKKDRHLTKETLKYSFDDTKLKYNILKNDGSYEVL